MANAPKDQVATAAHKWFFWWFDMIRGTDVAVAARSERLLAESARWVWSVDIWVITEIRLKSLVSLSLILLPQQYGKLAFESYLFQIGSSTAYIQRITDLRDVFKSVCRSNLREPGVATTGICRFVGNLNDFNAVCCVLLWRRLQIDLNILNLVTSNIIRSWKMFQRRCSWGCPEIVRSFVT